jgi:hypothetical protein
METNKDGQAEAEYLDVRGVRLLEDGTLETTPRLLSN